jgi:hypothetical protein
MHWAALQGLKMVGNKLSAKEPINQDHHAITTVLGIEAAVDDPEHKSLAGSLGTPHVSYIISINKDKVPPIRVYVSPLSQTKSWQMH